MAINARGYFDHLKSYLNMGFYAVRGLDGEISLREKIFTETGKKNIQVKLKYDGEVFAIKLDKKNNRGNHDPLFHFLDDTGKPWSKRCDFILFHLHRNKICVHCFEFKWGTISADSVIAQLEASSAWCRTLSNTIKNYTNKSRKLHLSKYVLTKHPKPDPYLDAENKYLNSDQSIRHYHYDDIDGMNLAEIENASVETIT